MINIIKKKIIIKALKFPRMLKIGLAIFLDAFLCIFATWIVLSFRLGELITFNVYYFLPALLSVILLIPILFFFGFYKSIFRFITGDTFRILGLAITVYTVLYSLTILLVEFLNVPRSVGLMQPMIMFILITFSRWLIKVLLSEFIRANPNGKSKKEVIIYGAGNAGRQLAAGLRLSQKYKFLFFVDDNKNFWGGTIDGYSVKSPSSIKKFSLQNGIKELWLAMPKLSGVERKKLINSLHGQYLHVRTLPLFSDLIDGKVGLEDLRELDINELLGREKVKPNLSLLKKCVFNKTVLVTGAGGSIGSEICRQIISFKPKRIILVENSEIALYNIHSDLLSISDKNHDTILIPLLIDVLDVDKLDHVFKALKPETVYHAAAYKHVPIVEHNIVSGVKNNFLGTLHCANLAIKYNVKHFVLISTDKAVRPTNIMGASKRLAEMSLQLLNDEKYNKDTSLSMVRFGNVLGSSGSVAPLFKKQIEAGGPVTLTHKDVTRYFMTIKEAAQLVIQAGAMSEGGEVFLLDMGKPIRIFDLARRMIEAKGLKVKDKINPEGDIEIQVNGLRHGEKLYEELLIDTNAKETIHPRILKAQESFLNKEDFQKLVNELCIYIEKNEVKKIVNILNKCIPEYTPSNHIVDWISKFKSD